MLTRTCDICGQKIDDTKPYYHVFGDDYHCECVAQCLVNGEKKQETGCQEEQSLDNFFTSEDMFEMLKINKVKLSRTLGILGLHPLKHKKRYYYSDCDYKRIHDFLYPCEKPEYIAPKRIVLTTEATDEKTADD